MEEKNRKKTYIKPQIEEIQLKAEEAVLAACKTPQTAGPFGGTRCNQGAGGPPPVKCSGNGKS